MNHGPSQQSSKDEYKPWKLGATARYYTFHTKTMLPTRKSVPRSSKWTTRKPPDDRKGKQTAVVWSRFPFIRSGQNHLARHSERGKKTRQREEEVGSHHQGMDRPRVRQVPEGSGERKNWENWLQNHLWCPNDPRGYGIDDDDDECVCWSTAISYQSHLNFRLYSIETICIYKHIYIHCIVLHIYINLQKSTPINIQIKIADKPT